MEKKLDGNYTRMLQAILNKSWRQHPTRHQLYGHLPPITKTIQVRQTRYAGHCWRSRDELISNVLLWTPTYGCGQKQDDQHEHIFSSYVRIQDVALKTCQRGWTIGKVVWEGQGYPCKWHNMMMMMMMITFGHANPNMMLDWNIVLNEFKLLSYCYIHFGLIPFEWTSLSSFTFV